MNAYDYDIKSGGLRAKMPSRGFLCVCVGGWKDGGKCGNGEEGERWWCVGAFISVCGALCGVVVVVVVMDRCTCMCMKQEMGRKCVCVCMCVVGHSSREHIMCVLVCG